MRTPKLFREAASKRKARCCIFAAIEFGIGRLEEMKESMPERQYASRRQMRHSRYCNVNLS